MSYLDYYRYQAEARGVRDFRDVIAGAESKGYVYDRIVLPWLPSDPSKAVAEIACGHGSFLHWLKERKFTNITGVDSSPEQLNFARQTGSVVQQADVNDWLSAQSTASYQAIVGIDLIEHISKDDLMKLLAQSYRILCPGGRIIFRYPNGDSPLVGMNLFNDITHIWTYTPNCLNSLAQMHGFVRSHFYDESEMAIRDHRWLKVPLCRLSQMVLGALFRSATKEKVHYWSPHLWACLEK
jgi:cyclopropane fatty-acyl-phospholipid synthase-like methyltransferase